MTNEVEIRVFVSYSHLDEEWKDELQGHLSFLKKHGDKVWQDRKIGPGSEWAGMIHEALDSSSIILLLIRGCTRRPGV
ncbi:MAG: toll/interleukin-1 receptor domain-containing protein [Ktedonobacteraceae bacterium]|nr:toll/interleukin-1 receptor domain-containing protein [Ktedonobacteraceae bacterium]